MSRNSINFAAMAVAALLAGCGGGDDLAADGAVVVLTDRPAIAAALAGAMPGRDVRIQAVPAASADAAVSAWAAQGARTVVAHYTPGASQSICAEAKRFRIGCVVTDPIDTGDLVAGQPGHTAYSGETYCDLAWLTSAEAQAQFLAQCIAQQDSRHLGVRA